MGIETKVLAEGLAFGEGPRWRDGKLWLSDMHNHVVLTVDERGHKETIVDVPNQPSGLGWLPDGRLLVVSMTDRKLMRLDPGGLEEVADLSDLATFHCNDMVVDALGRAYVGNFGADISAGAPGKTAVLALVTPAGRTRVVADELAFPNGAVITPDGRTLIIAETFAMRLTAFQIAADGSLGDRRVFAQVDGMTPDGICLDAEGAIWATSPLSGEVLRVHDGGRVSERFKPSRSPYACMLGGDDRRTLFVLTADGHEPEACRDSQSGLVEFTGVAVPGAGLP